MRQGGLSALIDDVRLALGLFGVRRWVVAGTFVRPTPARHEGNPDRSSSPMYAAPVYLLVFTGGFSVMSIELLAGRIFAPYFGHSPHVWGSIITVFMLALSVGYLLGGRISLARPGLTRFGLIFFVCAVTVLPLVFWRAPLMAWVFERVEDPRYGSLIAALPLFFVPTACLGFISPYAVRLLVETTGHAGHVAGKLYFMSTAGSALGTFTCTAVT